MADTLRAEIIGAGFIGAVHANAVRAAGSRVTRVAASTPTFADGLRAAALTDAVIRSSEFSMWVDVPS